MTPTSLPVARLAAVLVACAPVLCHALDYGVSVDAPPALADLLQQNLPLITEHDDASLTETDLDTLVRGTPDAARALLQTEGYFDAAVEVTAGRSDGKRQYRVQVEPGEPVTIASVDLVLDGPIAADAADRSARSQAILAQWPLPVGALFRQEGWDAAKRQALQRVSDERYPLARIGDSRVEIDPAHHRARVRLVIDSGPALRFGPLQIHGLSRYPESLVRKLADFQPGDWYRQQALQDYQNALGQSQQFAGALVAADLQHLDGDRVPVEVELHEQPLKKLEFGLTYDTDVGFGTRIAYDHNNLFGTGLTGSSVLNWDNSRQSLSFGISLPRSADGYVHTLSTSIKRTDVQGLVTESEDVGVWRTHARGTDESRLGLEYLQESQHVVGENSQNSHALLPTVGWTRRAVDNLLRPRSGYLLDGTLSGTVGSWLSSTTFVRVYGRAAGYWSPWPQFGTWLARIELGQVWAGNVDNVPASQLFRAGGTNSVRGYDYQSLGLAGANNAVVGGRVLATATLEYQIPLTGDWALALFSDAGNAVDSWRDFHAKRSYGVGVRWFSPVAPLSFDLAKPSGGGNVVWNMSLGLAF